MFFNPIAIIYRQPQGKREHKTIVHLKCVGVHSKQTLGLNSW